jgi:serine/threonine-protein kinase
MGIVYRARDESTGQIVALKQLLSSRAHGRRDTFEALFQREFHTLAGLRHPRIIEVYDYGHSEHGPYYTMELLGGPGLRELAPLPQREACSHVRDIASSLALIHARRILHRDVSPGNVRLSTDGRAKLIDFGALATFGTCEDVIGTAPCVPPEVLQWFSLDQRTDLYSLGAVLYWLLTGRHAYRVRKLEELFEAWRTPPLPPSTLAAGVPPALDDLVSSLLSLDPLGRPASAALVIERLNAIAELEPENEAHQAASYLLSIPMVGRETQLEHIMGRLAPTLDEGVGAAVVVEGPSGIGKTRLLDEVYMRARL